MVNSSVLLVAIVFQVLMRYALGLTNTMLEDSLWYLFAITLTLGLSYTMTHDGHVRVDFLYQHYSLKTKVIVDVLGSPFLSFRCTLFFCGMDGTTPKIRCLSMKAPPTRVECLGYG